MVFIVATMLFWRDTPVGIVALMLMCGGDGLADIAGRRWGRVRLPWAPRKSWAGTVTSAALLTAYVLIEPLGWWAAPFWR